MNACDPRSFLVLAACLGPLSVPRGPAGPTQETPAAPRADAELRATLAAEGVLLDLDAGLLSIPATVLVRDELLEYLLVSPSGAAHESLFRTTVRPSLLNAALLLLGVEPGRNAHFEEEASGKDEDGRPFRRVYPPQGDGFYLYAGWREGGETYFFRVEDLVRNLASGRSLRRHRWVYLGSRFQALKPGAAETFLADVEGNLVNLSFFFQGNTLLTAAVEECIEQTIWAANEWLLPPAGAPVRLFFARAPLAGLAAELGAALPEVPPEDGDAEDGEAQRAPAGAGR